MTRYTQSHWEPAVFRWSARTALVVGSVSGALALVWGDDLQGGGLAYAALLTASLATVVATTTFAHAYRRMARAVAREAAMRRHPAGTQIKEMAR